MPHSRAVSSIIEYVEEHFTESITAERIARELHFSETYVSHRFKDEMGITLYQYLLKKKLVHAFAIIRSGTPATEAAQSCGFSDYSTFYKRYKARFGTSPSRAAKE
ncbi:MAG: helix-turn-helix transcriptional regulator [Ruminococcaceae bacterium]|nr:helix-turn-helix transcriptional regulator [Oscillospiraceae bacterium]